MNINTINLNEYEDDLLNSVISSMRNKYYFANISINDFNRLVKCAIEESISTNKNESKKINLSILKKELVLLINNYIVINNDDNSIIELLDRFIDINMKYENDTRSNINELKKISNLFKNMNYFVNVDLFLNVLNNNQLLNAIVKNIVDNNYDSIINGNIELKFDDDIIICIIEAFCILNNIKYETNDIDDIVDDLDFLNEDSVKAYLKDINLPLLTKEEEKEICVKIKNGDSSAKKELIEKNLRLVVSIAKKYRGRGIDFLDLIQEGNIGLSIAADKYDVEKGYRFSSYATNWIKQSIMKNIANNSRNIRIPTYLFYEICTFKKTYNLLKSKNNDNVDPTIGEVAKQLGISLEKANKLYKLQNDTLSLNSIVNSERDGESSELGNFISSSNITPEEEIIDKSLCTEVKELLYKCNLKYKEIDVLILRYGLFDSNSYTLDEIGKMYGLTRERVRQIEKNAILKIRNSDYLKDLAIFMNNPDLAINNLKNSIKDEKSKRLIKNDKDKKIN